MMAFESTALEEDRPRCSNPLFWFLLQDRTKSEDDMAQCMQTNLNHAALHCKINR